ncbi:MAG TPA: SMP-30/gluconolactonase/LRE family protein [Flavisolibacter sp.]|nr:SMP-30/gluconolactonase/LRE family protein [Flavisolibacter sp.]
MNSHNAAVKALPVPVSELGEGPVWDAQEHQIIWVDIERGKIQSYHPATQQYKSFSAGQMVGSVALASSGKVVGALQNGFALIDMETNSVVMLGDPESDLQDNRFNDGKCDAAGRFWAGTMCMKGDKNKGGLYVLDKKTVTQKLTGVSCSNGLAWGVDNTILYFIDSPTRSVVAFEYDLSSGEIKNGRNIITIAEKDGFPDGMTIDAEGMLWIALWGGGKVQRRNPFSSIILQEISLPVSLVTSCTFGGEDLTDLYITTATKGLTESERKAQPLAGCLFVVQNSGYQGIPAALFNEG